MVAGRRVRASSGEWVSTAAMVRFDRRSVVLAGLAGLVGVAGATADEPRRHGHRRGDHDCARRALAEGRARPLTEILPMVESELGGQAIEIELEHCSGRIQYEVKLLRPDGQLVEAKVDALTGKIVEGD
ncbi:hypothetical protein BVIR_1785 [Blastochloris viridis]|nr:hypothetical protein BVIR_1785 [Blastochloris viridis]CUU42222.1 hypothetical protein BVIRIDIS_12300 [Blastochloris viridis]